MSNMQTLPANPPSHFKLIKENCDDIIPKSTDSQNTRLNDISFQGYNTFHHEKGGVYNPDEGGIEYDSQYYVNQYIDKHPTQSRYSMYSIQYIHRMSGLNKALSTTSNKSTISHAPERIYTFCGEIYRNCCFTALGMRVILSINIILVLLNIFLIIYEVILLAKSQQSYLNTDLPILFFICDAIITVILIIEVLLHWYIGYMCSCFQYLFNSTCDNKIDVIVMILSILCCIFYVTDFGDTSNIDNLLFLVIRISRDLIRIIRCYFFFKLLHDNLAFDFAAHFRSDPQVSRLAKMKSAKSQMLWDKYVKQRELYPHTTMLKVASTAAISRVPSTAPIQENKPLESNDDINETDGYLEDDVFVPSKVNET